MPERCLARLATCNVAQYCHVKVILCTLKPSPFVSVGLQTCPYEKCGLKTTCPSPQDLISYNCWRFKQLEAVLCLWGWEWCQALGLDVPSNPVKACVCISNSWLRFQRAVIVVAVVQEQQLLCWRTWNGEVSFPYQMLSSQRLGGVTHHNKASDMCWLTELCHGTTLPSAAAWTSSTNRGPKPGVTVVTDVNSNSRYYKAYFLAWFLIITL